MDTPPADNKFAGALPRKTNMLLLVGHPMAFARKYWWALAILTIGTLTDGITTYLTVGQLGPANEMNPVQRPFFQLVGVTAGIPLAKLMQFVAALVVGAWWAPWTAWVLTLAGLIYGAAALSNHLMLL